ncbi:DUF5682 family protein [Actinoplanes teichomyceticus]|uniref:Uncharacterized protein n=1 Tax=Actinoplanes teichomyceticus TaxID=1867 RepID=A0A561VRY4_ACTTI|nr:DUF5682 family protein [Actinoplanes teichomyceticus]TWG14395.1 hypothetical protein FHX34_104695 [Actinoplanes teichomyceticus]GIF13044.1 hypothetical protein Ate01nite_30760 [Actinoplanes teichomyceticus]
MPERFYGVRHHGPGSARAVVRELAAQQPDVLLVEGPPEADDLVRWVADSGLEPPVALLGYAVDDPGRAAFWPFAVFSPEWQAIRWAVANDVPVRFFDLPYAYRVGAPGAGRSSGSELPDGASETGGPHPPGAPGQTAEAGDPGVPERAPDAVGDTPAAAGASEDGGAEAPNGDAATHRATGGNAATHHTTDGDAATHHTTGGDTATHRAAGGEAAAPQDSEAAAPRDGDEGDRSARPVDPIGELAAAAGYDDPERWWEDVVEHRGVPVFEAIAEAMTAIREAAPEDPDDLLREAYMRTVLREVRRKHQNIAVVCGAWHVPALIRRVPIKQDTALLRGRRKGKVAFTWVPWTYGRLASWSGYGAGVSSPGWYHHLFTSADSVVPRWLVSAAGVLRAEGVPTSSAHVIEATRLAEALATLRGRPLAGLAEVTEAAEAVMCDGEPLRTELIARRLVVGERLGTVPDEMPAVPLARDLAAQQRTLRLRPEATERRLELDLRKDTDLRRSRLLHRLRTLDVPWGEPAAGRRGTGTFREEWMLRWQPEFAVRLVEGSMWGTTVAAAATARVVRRAGAARTLAEVTALLETCLLADLAEAYPRVLAALDTRAALDADVHHLMAALPALARTLRYGDVRRTDVAGLAAVTASLLKRICAGLPSAAGSLADEAAKQLRDGVDGVHHAVSLLADDDLRELWLATVESLARRPDLHGLPAGRLTRLLLEAGRLDAAEVRRRLRLPLTVGTPPAHAAAWVEGFLSGGGLLLVHDDALLGLVDEWLADVPAEAFDDVLPLLRRTFASFDAGERRAIGERVAGPRPGAPATGAVSIDEERALSVLPVLGALLGREIRIREDA